MNVYISSDIEGTAGIVAWDQVIPQEASYELGRRLLTAEINAAIDGAMTSGATSFVVNDAHHSMHNLDPEELAGNASYLSGSFKPMYMMEGLTSDHDAVFFIAYHGAVGGASSVLSHTYNPRAFIDLELNDEQASEASINALVALAHGVPVALITGDRQTIEQSRTHLPGAEAVVVKESLSSRAAKSLHPDAARLAIARGAARGTKKLGDIPLPAIELPASIKMTFASTDQAELASWIQGAERTAHRVVTLSGQDPLALYKRFVAVVQITRAAEN